MYVEVGDLLRKAQQSLPAHVYYQIPYVKHLFYNDGRIKNRRAGDSSFDNICGSHHLNWHITSAFSINKVQVLTTYTLVRATSVNANVKLIRAIE